MPHWLRSLVWPLLFVSIAAVVYTARIRREMVDFGVYRTAAVRAAAAEPLYRTSDGHYQFKYLPAFALALTPFGKLDPEAAKTVWFALSVGWLTAFVRWSVRALPERRRSERVLLWLSVLLMAKFYAHELTLGQTNILLGVLLVGALLAVQIDQPVTGAVLIGVAAFVKPYSLLLLPWIAVTGGMRAVTAGVAVVLTGLILPAVWYGWTGNLDLIAGWVRTATSSTPSTLVGNDNISMAAMWAKWLGIGTPATTLAIATGATLVTIAFVTWLRRRSVSSPEFLEYSMLLLLIPLLSPQGWDYVLLLATPAVICLVDRFGALTRPWQAIVAIALALMGLTIYDLMGRALYSQFMAWSIVSVAAVAVVASLAHLRWRALA